MLIERFGLPAHPVAVPFLFNPSSKVISQVLLQAFQLSHAPLFVLQVDSIIPPFFVIAVCTLFGALIGSFLNVVIHRLPLNKSIAFPNSRCPNCGTAISFYDNIPILSYLMLGGRCRACNARISPRYPAVEALTAILFMLVALTQGGEFTLRLVFHLAFVAAIVALIFIDAEHMILPNKITYPGFALALVASLFVPNVYGIDLFVPNAMGTNFSVEAMLWTFMNRLLGALVGGGSLWLVGWLWKRARGVEAMGLGDVKMMLMVGAYLGPLLVILTIFIGFLLGAIIGVAWMWRTGTRDTSAQIPFGISLGIGSIVSLLFGVGIINWYLGQFRM